MPSAVDLVINNGAGSPVAKTFTLMAPAAGYGSVTDWALKEGVITSVFPRMSMSARKTGNRSQKALFKVRVPSSYTDTVTGLTKVGSAFEAYIETSVPDDFPESLKNDAIAFTVNAVQNAVIKACLRDGLPAT